MNPVLGTSVGGAPDMICSPMVTWPEGVETDVEVLEEVMNPWTREIVGGKDGGLLALSEVIQSTWKERTSKWGEKEEYMGGNRIWADIESDLKEHWEVVWKENEDEGLAVIVT